jgi:tetratricopeptide (TPR) repeat protein
MKKLTRRQKKEILGFSILAILTVLMVIYQGYLKEKHRKKIVILRWSPERTTGDLQQEISARKRNDNAEECFQKGTELLKQARKILDRNLFREAQKKLECADNAFSTFSTKFNLAFCLFYLENFSAAGDLFLQAMQIHPDSCGVENFMGLCMINTGHWKEGMDRLSSALQKARDQEKKTWEAVILSNIGVVFKHMGNLDKAEQYHDLSLVLCQKIGYKRGEAGELVNLAHLTASRGEVERALRIFDNALVIYRKIDDGRGEASTLGYIAQLYQERLDINNAVKFYQQALAVSREAGYHFGVADTLMELGTIAYQQKKPDQALSHYLQAEKSYHQAGLVEGTSALLGNLGLLYKDKKEYRLALEYYQKALVLDRSTRYLHGEAYDLYQIGLIYEATGKRSKALDAYRQAKDLFESLLLDEQVKEINNRIQALSTPALAP